MLSYKGHKKQPCWTKHHKYIYCIDTFMVFTSEYQVFTGEYQFSQANTSFHRWVLVFGIFMVFTSYFSINSATIDFSHRIKSSQWLKKFNMRTSSPPWGSGWWYLPSACSFGEYHQPDPHVCEDFLVFTCISHCNW